LAAAPAALFIKTGTFFELGNGGKVKRNCRANSAQRLPESSNNCAAAVHFSAIITVLHIGMLNATEARSIIPAGICVRGQPRKKIN
jgi:hypothetical protein